MVWGKKFLNVTFFTWYVFLWFWVVFSNYCQNVLRAVVKTVLYVSRGIIWLACLQNFPLFVRFWTKIYRSFDCKVSPLFTKQHSTFRGTIGEKRFLYTFVNFFLNLSDFSWNFGRITTTDLSKLNYTFPGETFGHIFLEKFITS